MIRHLTQITLWHTWCRTQNCAKSIITVQMQLLVMKNTKAYVERLVLNFPPIIEVLKGPTELSSMTLVLLEVLLRLSLASLNAVCGLKKPR